MLVMAVPDPAIRSGVITSISSAAGRGRGELHW